jgi:hypothetical protein
MSKFIKIHIAILLLITGIVCAAAPQNEMNSILASVNGTPISLQDILPLTRAAEFRVFSSCVGEELQKRILEIRRRAADELIDRKRNGRTLNEIQPFVLEAIPIHRATNARFQAGKAPGCIA